MHSWPMIVESISATNRRFHRGSSGCTRMSTFSRPSIAQRALPSPCPRSAGRRHRLRRSNARNAAAGSSSRSSPSARSINLSSRLPAAISVATLMPSPKPPLVFIAGPTASGKSALALALAQQIDGVIVNADSAQVYRDLPSPERRTDQRMISERAEHRLYGVQDGAEPCSAADWAEMARREIAELHADGCTPILVGGTGLYLRTLLDGIAPVPAIDADVRDRVRSTASRGQSRQAGAPWTRPRPSGSSRPIPRGSTRALEVILSTGRTLAEWQQERSGGVAADVDLRPLLLLPPRKWLYARCDERFAHMIDQGAVERGRSGFWRASSTPICQSCGRSASGSFRLMLGEATLEEAIAAGQQATRRYAKRQYTWFAHQPPAEWPRFQEALDVKRLAMRWPCFGRTASRQSMDLLRDARHRSFAARGQARRGPRLWQPGRAQALNLRDSGVDVVVALRPGSLERSARRNGRTAGPAASRKPSVGADVVMMLAPDETHGRAVPRDRAAPAPRGCARL